MTVFNLHLIRAVLPSGFIHRFWLFFSLLVIQVMWSSLLSFGQGQQELLQVRERFDRAYGSDYNLLNGRQYTLFYSSISDPFLNGEQARPGRLVLNGAAYEGVPINYDLYQQAVILQFISHTGEIRYLVLNRDAVDEFALDGKMFSKASLSGEAEQYVQVIEKGSRRFIISWRKDMNYGAFVNRTPYTYNKALKRIYLENQGGAPYPVRSRSSFLVPFSEDHRAEIRHYLRKERIRFKSATDRQLEKLLEYCNGLEEDGS